ncbi:MAG: hypothetical protein ACTJG2_02655 [Candidatus Saccharimonadales bacterium]
MKQESQLSPLGRLLAQSLHTIDQYDTHLTTIRQDETIHINTVGSKLTAAYEQLRNASEQAESGGILRQKAIRRFFVRTLSFHEKISTKQLGDELLTELTQAGYLPNNYLTEPELKALSAHIKRYYNAYWKYIKIESNGAKRQRLKEWALDVLSVRCEQVLQPNIRAALFTNFAYTYLQPLLPMQELTQPGEHISPDDRPIILYIAIQKTILQLDRASIRAGLLDSYRQDITLLHNFESFNGRIDHLFDTKTTARVARVVNRNGATLRMIFSGFFAKNGGLTVKDLTSEDTLSYALSKHVEHEYTVLDKVLDSGIGKSIVFLLITKSIIGLAIEVPYDIAVEGHIAWLPLLLNLFFPSLFIALSRLTLTVPGPRNTEAIAHQAAQMLFMTDQQEKNPIKIRRKTSSTGFTIAYGCMFAFAFASLSYILYLLQFNIVQGAIFFIFLSTASFLAFRLSEQIREVEALSLSQGSMALLRDVLYMPFIYVGQQISFRYAKMNFVAATLDTLIEMPLKSLLRIARQWTTFLNNKKDDLL